MRLCSKAQPMVFKTYIYESCATAAQRQCRIHIAYRASSFRCGHNKQLLSALPFWDGPKSFIQFWVFPLYSSGNNIVISSDMDSFSFCPDVLVLFRNEYVDLKKKNPKPKSQTHSSPGSNGIYTWIIPVNVPSSNRQVEQTDEPVHGDQHQHRRHTLAHDLWDHPLEQNTHFRLPFLNKWPFPKHDIWNLLGHLSFSCLNQHTLFSLEQQARALM